MDRSSRGQVDPFIVMDMVAEANRLEALGQRIIHMEVGQPSTPAPKAALAAVSAAGVGGFGLYRIFGDTCTAGGDRGAI